MKNWYRLNKAELAHLSAIEEPLYCTATQRRISTPVVIATYDGMVAFVWTLSWYKFHVAKGILSDSYKYEIKAMY